MPARPGCPSPPRSPRRSPSRSAEAAAAAGRGRAAAPKAPSKIDLIRAKARGEAPPADGAGRRGPGGRAPAPRPAAKAGKKVKRAEARPSLVWLGRRQAQRAGRPAQRRVRRRAPSRSSRPALLVPPEKLVEVALYLRDRNPIKYDYLASLQSVHYEDCIEVNYQLDSTDKPGHADRAAGPHRRGRGRRARSRRSITSTAGPTSRSAKSTT